LPAGRGVCLARQFLFGLVPAAHMRGDAQLMIGLLAKPVRVILIQIGDDPLRGWIRRASKVSDLNRLQVQLNCSSRFCFCACCSVDWGRRVIWVVWRRWRKTAQLDHGDHDFVGLVQRLRVKTGAFFKWATAPKKLFSLGLWTTLNQLARRFISGRYYLFEQVRSRRNVRLPAWV